MCALCGVLLKTHWTEEGGGRRQRLVQARMLAGVLGHFGLAVRDWGGRAYLVDDRKGRTALVDDIGGLWAAAEKLTGRKLDPLDPALLQALGDARG